MALDTRSRRASALGIVQPWTLTLPPSDGTVGQADRQHVAFCYAGITAASLSALNLHTATTRSLMSDRSSLGLTATRTTQSLMTDRITEAG
jgi:hypothetical protein